MATITVIVPVFNVDNYLKRCINSLLRQFFKDFDLILVDDGSSDNSGAICDQYEKIDYRVHVIHQNNGGLSAARNSGIEWSLSYSDSSWITFIDSDDWVHPQYLQVLYDLATKFQRNISICAYKEVGDDESSYEDLSNNSAKQQGYIVNSEEFYRDFRVNAIVAWGKLYKKEYFKTIRYPIGRIHEDEFTTYKLLFKQSSIAFINEPYYYYYINEKGIMKTQSKNKRGDALEAYMEQIKYFEEHKLEIAKKVMIWEYAGKISEWIDTLKASKMFDKKDRKLQGKLIKQLRKVLKEYHLYIPYNSCKWAYSVAYPKQVRYYELIYRIYKRIQKK